MIIPVLDSDLLFSFKFLAYDIAACRKLETGSTRLTISGFLNSILIAGRLI
jgi:hypothetical protein